MVEGNRLSIVARMKEREGPRSSVKETRGSDKGPLETHTLASHFVPPSSTTHR